jgi:carotenoid cleavage dioxygenase
MREELTLEALGVSGTIPEELDGRYVRIGPNPASAPNPGSYHWFLGDGMVHGVRLQGGRALWYRNRWIRSRAVSRALGLPEAPGPRNGLSDTVNTNVMSHAGAGWALVEAGGFPVRIGEDLETLAHDPFGGTLTGSFSAHPHLDPDTGELHAICYSGQDTETIRHVVVDACGRVRREEPVKVQDGPSIHDCMITANYVIILDLPVTFSMKRLIAGYGFPYAWNPAHRARVGLLPREGRGEDVIWCETDPCYVFHPCNGFETPEGKVILDVCAHTSMFASSTMGPDSSASPLERWTIDPVSRRVGREVIDPDSQEFPRPNEARIGKPYRFAYTVAAPGGIGEGQISDGRIYKHDLEARSREVRDFGPGRMAGEFVFVARDHPAGEDDGWLMGYVIDTQADTTDLVILRASDFTGPPQAVVHMPHRIPPGFHGNWIPSASGGG